MSEHVDFERLVAGHIADEGINPPSDAFYDELFTRAARKGPRPEWLALIKEPPMRTNSRLAAGSPTARIVAILAATLLLAMALAAAGAGAQRLFAADGPIVVAADGSGDHTTIQAGIDAAEDGDEVLVRPGTYAEEVLIEDKDITLRGDGPIEDVVIELAGGKLVTLTQTDTEIADLTLRGDDFTEGVNVRGGAPTIRGLHFERTREPHDGTAEGGDGGSIAVWGGSPHVVENRFTDGGTLYFTLDANVVFEDNELTGGPHIFLENPGEESVVRDNTISGTLAHSIGLYAPSTMTISGNTIDGAGTVGIEIGWNTATGMDPLVEGNTISDSTIGVHVYAGSAAVVEDNEFEGNGTAARVESNDALLTGNVVIGNDTGAHTGVGIDVSAGASPTIRGNQLEGLDLGIGVRGAETVATIEGNRFCDNGQGLALPEGEAYARGLVAKSNEVCDAAVE